MTISGFERPSQIEAQIAALERERLNPRSEAHVEAVDGQLALFRAEAERMLTEGIKDPVRPASQPWVGTAWTGGPWGQAWSSRG